MGLFNSILKLLNVVTGVDEEIKEESLKEEEGKRKDRIEELKNLLRDTEIKD